MVAAAGELREGRLEYEELEQTTHQPDGRGGNQSTLV
jgi:hypothetical protein